MVGLWEGLNTRTRFFFFIPSCGPARKNRTSALNCWSVLWAVRQVLLCKPQPAWGATTEFWFISSQPKESDYVHGVLTSQCPVFFEIKILWFLPDQRLMRRCCKPPRISLSSCLPSLFWSSGCSRPPDLPPSGLPGQPGSSCQLYLETPKLQPKTSNLLFFFFCFAVGKECLHMFKMCKMRG